MGKKKQTFSRQVNIAHYFSKLCVPRDWDKVPEETNYDHVKLNTGHYYTVFQTSHSKSVEETTTPTVLAKAGNMVWLKPRLFRALIQVNMYMSITIIHSLDLNGYKFAKETKCQLHLSKTHLDQNLS